MQINNSTTNVPFKAPAEVDGQDRSQTRQQTSDQQSQLNTRSSTDTVSLSSEAQSLNTQRIDSSDAATTTLAQPATVDPGQTAKNVNQDPQTTTANLQAQTNIPAEQPTDSTSRQPSRPEASQTQASDTSTETTPPTSDTTRLQATSNAAQTVTPQNRNSAQKPAQESPMAAAGGLAAGTNNIDLSV